MHFGKVGKIEEKGLERTDASRGAMAMVFSQRISVIGNFIEWKNCGDKWNSPKLEQAKTKYSGLALAREFITITCVLLETQRQAEWEKFRMKKMKRFFLDADGRGKLEVG